MSINMDSFSQAEEYADYFVQIIGLTNETDDTLSSDGIEALEQFEPVSGRGIDSNELAELVAMRRVMSVKLLDDGTGGGGVEAEYNLGINLSGESEFPTDGFNNNPTAQESTDTGGGADGRKVSFNYEEPGVLDYDAIQFAEGRGDQTAVRELTAFRPVFGSGPVLDRTDDIVIGQEMLGDSAAEARLETVVTLYWDVYEHSGSRGDLRRPI